MIILAETSVMTWWACYDSVMTMTIKLSSGGPPPAAPGWRYLAQTEKRCNCQIFTEGERFTHLGTWQQPVMRGEQCTMGNYESCRHFGIILGAKISRQSCGDLWPSCPTSEGSWHLETHTYLSSFYPYKKDLNWVIRSTRKGPGNSLISYSAMKRVVRAETGSAS